MRDEPAGADLLDIAEATVRETLLPALPGHLHYEARMVANAMRIAARQMRADTAAEDTERAALATLLGEDAPLPDLNRRFAQALRAGAFDADPGPARAVLLSAAVARLAEANPRALDRARAEGLVPQAAAPSATRED